MGIIMLDPEVVAADNAGAPLTLPFCIFTFSFFSAFSGFSAVNLLFVYFLAILVPQLGQII